MRTRMLVAFLALTAVVLLALEVPLAISLARRERDARATTAQRDAAALAALTEEAIEHPAAHDLAGLVSRYTRHTDLSAVIVGRDGRPLAAVPLIDDEGEGEGDPAYRAAASAALAGRPTSGPITDEGHGRRFVATPIGSGAAIDGAVIVTYPNGPTERAVH